MARGYVHLELVKRSLIETQLRLGLRPAAIALGWTRARSTVLREMRRNGWQSDAEVARRGRAIVRQDAELLRKFQQLLAIPGIGETSAVQLLSELAGLDPAHRLSGTSLHLPSRISRHLRRALYMPALVGVRWDLISRPSIRLSRLATKPNSWPSWPSHANCSMPSSDSSRQNTPYDGATLFPQLLTTS